jgi:hypothetical protein
MPAPAGPAQLPRIQEMTRSLTERLAEAKDRAWFAEVAALAEPLTHLQRRQAEAESQLHEAAVKAAT